MGSFSLSTCVCPTLQGLFPETLDPSLEKMLSSSPVLPPVGFRVHGICGPPGSAEACLQGSCRRDIFSSLLLAVPGPNGLTHRENNMVEEEPFLGHENCSSSPCLGKVPTLSPTQAYELFLRVSQPLSALPRCSEVHSCVWWIFMGVPHFGLSTCPLPGNPRPLSF